MNEPTTPYWRLSLPFRGDADGFFRVQASADWIAEYRVVKQGGHRVLAEARIFPGDLKQQRAKRTDRSLERGAVPNGGMTSTVLRGVNLGEHRALFYRALQQGVRQHHEALAAGPRPVSELVPNIELTPIAPTEEMLPVAALVDPERGGISVDEPRRPGRRGHPDRRYAEVAARYVAVCEAGSRKPVADVARAMDESQHYIRDLLRKARERELLTPTVRGRSGGALTEKGRAALAEARR